MMTDNYQYLIDSLEQMVEVLKNPTQAYDEFLAELDGEDLQDENKAISERGREQRIKDFVYGTWENLRDDLDDSGITQAPD